MQFIQECKFVFSMKNSHTIHHINRLKEKKLNYKMISVDEEKAYNKIQYLELTEFSKRYPIKR